MTKIAGEIGRAAEVVTIDMLFLLFLCVCCFIYFLLAVPSIVCNNYFCGSSNSGFGVLRKCDQ